MSVVPLPSMSASRMRFWSNWSGWSKCGACVHGDLGAEPAVAEVGPVADLAIADADQVGKTVAAEVGEIDGLGAVGKDEAGAFLFIQYVTDPPGWSEAFFRQRGVPDRGIVFADQHISVAVTVQVDELQVGVARVAIKARA